MPVLTLDEAPDLERRFGGLRRLYGDVGYGRIRDARAAVVGVGGVGSWVAEALARSGIGGLTLIDPDHVAESNINRQVQALGVTIGQAKVLALRARLLDIHPACAVHCVEEFVDEANWPELLAEPIDVVVDACDEVRAKAVIAAWGVRTGHVVVTVGAAGGKRHPQAVEVDDLALVTHDPLLAALRSRLRKSGEAPRNGPIGVRCIFSREAVMTPESSGRPDAGLNCHGYGSSVAMTATFGMVAGGVALECLATVPAMPGLL